MTISLIIMRTRRKQAERSAETSTRILDGAQKLFARYGYEGVSMRAVASEAQVNLASIVYYFESKEGLYFAVFERYAEDLLEARKKAVAIVDQNPSMEGYVRAFLQPSFLILLNPQFGGKDFALFLWRLPHEPQFILEKIGPKYITPIYEIYADKVKIFYPDIAQDDLQWFLHITRALFFSTLGRCAMNDIWPSEEWAKDSNEIMRRMVNSLCAALKSMLE